MSTQTPDDIGSTISECPDRQQILALALGQASSTDVETIQQHLRTCPTCRAFAHQHGIGTEHNLGVNQVHHPTVDEVGLQNQVRQRTSHVDAAKVHDGRASAADVDQGTNQFDFLSPPESVGELGRLGHYRILRELGQGGMGIVFEAEDTQLQRRVAIKVLRSKGLDTSIRLRFLQEARLAASIHSDRIVTIFQVDEERGCPYFIMELLKGESLETCLAHRHKLNVADTLRIAREVAEGLAAAHDHALIHRDIKPANVWLEGNPQDLSLCRVKLLDFGIARSLKDDSNLTQEGRIIGTPTYMSPEQASGESPDQRSDLFSLGSLIYAMLTGQSPFERQNTMMSIRAVGEASLPAFHETLPNVPLRVRQFLARLLSLNPADRPDSARHAVEEIRGLEMSLGKPSEIIRELPSIVREAVKHPKRRDLWSAWLGVFILMVAGLVGVTVQYQKFTAPGAENPDNISNDSGASRPAEGVPNIQRPVSYPSAAKPPIKVGILHSQTGPMAASERALIDAFEFAIEEINHAGGLLGGRLIQKVIRDGKSFESEFAKQALELIRDEKVVTLFGVWRSSCRQSVEIACKDHDYLLVFPSNYEGLEESANVIYMGGTSNQQTIPGIRWAYADLKKRKFFLVGTEGMFSRGIHEVIKDEVTALGATVVGDEFQPVADVDFSRIVKRIKESQADIVINSVVGIGNNNLFAGLRKAGLRPDSVPVLSLNVTEEELQTLGPRGETIAGNYATGSYFQSLETKNNQDFINKFRKRFGVTRVISDPMVAAYIGMHLWAKAVEATKSENVDDIRRSIVQQSFDGPEGVVTIDPKTQIARRMALIGEVNDQFGFDVVWTSPRPLDPEPYPPSRTRQAWDEFVRSVRDRYGKRWSAEYGHESEADHPHP